MAAGAETASRVIVVEGYKVHYTDYISRGFEIAKKYMMQFLGFSLLYLLAIYLFSYVPLIGGALMSIMLAGGVVVTLKILRGEQFTFSNFLDGFSLYFVPLLLFGIVSSLLISIGFFVFIIPGIYLLIAYAFGVHFIVDQKLEFWDAMESSRKTITKNFLSIFLFQILVGLVLTAPFIVGGILVLIAISLFAAGDFGAIIGGLLVLVAIVIWIGASLLTVPTAIITNTVAYLDIMKQGGYGTSAEAPTPEIGAEAAATPEEPAAPEETDEEKTE